MKKNDFTHLRFNSEYCLKDGFLKIQDIIKYVKLNNQSALAITDNNLFGAIEFYNTCIKNKIKPIIGCNFFIKNKRNKNKLYKLLLLVKNQIGYKNIIKIINKSILIKNNNDQEFYEIDKNWFKGNLNKGLILLSSYKESDIGVSLLNNNKKKAIKFALFWSKYFKNRFYIEIENNDKKNFFYNKKLIKLSCYLNLPLVASYTVNFIKKKDFYLYKIKNCILNNNNINNFNKKFLKYKNNFFIKKKKFLKIFKNFYPAIINNWKITQKCNLDLDLNKIELPLFYNKVNNNKFLLKLGLKFLKRNFLKNNLHCKNKKKIYIIRLLSECKIVISIGISDYFLIVSDFIRWAKKKDIPVGPGRGSSSGSLLSYVLKITNLDPIINNLIFERFLNIKRLFMPDFDIDFCPLKRIKIINYIKKKYGISNVCQIVTFGKIASKASIRDIGRVLNINYLFVDKLSKLISFKDSDNNMNDILKSNKELNFRYNNEIEVKKIINLVIKLEGGVKNIGIHAGGIIISHNKIYNFIPLYIQNNIIIVQYSKNSLEKVCLLKFDFLGLKTLTIINKCIKNIKKNFKIKINLLNLNLNDKNCFLKLKLGETGGVFQLESEGMKKMIKKANPDSFENIIALTSLYRPGPINLIKNFCLRKNGKEKITYFNERLKDILKETYGIIIYQEQIIFIVKTISNFSLENADLLRIAISKKDSKEMYLQKINFINNGIINGFSEKFLKDIFNKIEKFSKYGFNKSHAAAYSLISYYTMWLKSYYFSEFISSNLSYSLNNVKKIKFLINESLNNNTFILPLDINKSFYNSVSYKNFKINKIRYGFSNIKGLGENAIKSLIKTRKNNFFKDFNNFYLRIEKDIINKKIIETLICSGAFDSLENNRGNLYYKYKIILNNKLKKNINVDYKNIFFWKFKIKSLEERIRLGFFFINNIYYIYHNRVNFIIKNRENLKNINLIFGILNEFYQFYINKEKYYILIIENENYSIVRIKEDLYEKNLNILKLFNFVIIFYYIKNNYFLEAYKVYNEDFL